MICVPADECFAFPLPTSHSHVSLLALLAENASPTANRFPLTPMGGTGSGPASLQVCVLLYALHHAYLSVVT